MARHKFFIGLLLLLFLTVSVPCSVYAETEGDSVGDTGENADNTQDNDSSDSVEDGAGGDSADDGNPDVSGEIPEDADNKGQDSESVTEEKQPDEDGAEEEIQTDGGNPQEEIQTDEGETQEEGRTDEDGTQEEGRTDEDNTVEDMTEDSGENSGDENRQDNSSHSEEVSGPDGSGFPPKVVFLEEDLSGNPVSGSLDSLMELYVLGCAMLFILILISAIGSGALFGIIVVMWFRR